MSCAVAEYCLTLRDGRNIAVKHYGGDGVPVLALHGWLDNADSFLPMSAALVAAGCQLVCVDLAGHGESDHRTGNNPYLIVNDLADIQEIAALLNWSRFGLLGHSRGGSIAALYAAAMPEQVFALGLIDRLWPEVYAAENTIEQIRATLLQAAPRIRAFPSFEAMLAARTRHGFGISEAAARILVARNTIERADGWHWRYDPQLKQKSMLMLTEAQGECLLQSLAVPTSLILASGGLALLEPAYASKLAGNPQIAWQLVEGGHHLHMEQHAAMLAAHFGQWFVSHAA